MAIESLTDVKNTFLEKETGLDIPTVDQNEAFIKWLQQETGLDIRVYDDLKHFLFKKADETSFSSWLRKLGYEGALEEMQRDFYTQRLGFMIPLTSGLNYYKGDDRVFEFDGVDDFVDLKGLGQGTISNGSIEIKIKPSSILDSTIIKKGSGARPQIIIQSEKIVFTIYDGASFHEISSTTSVILGIEMLIKVTWGSSGMKLYINNTLEDTDVYTGTYDTQSSNWIIGSSLGTSVFFTGNIDYVKFWDDQTQTNLIANYDLTSSSATLGKDNVLDLSGNGNHGTSYGKSEFTRSTSGTYVEDGIVKTAGIDIARFEDGGILIEEERENLFLNSESPATQTITVLNATKYSIRVKGTGSITLSGGGSGTVSEGTNLAFTTTSTSVICTVSGTLTSVQFEKGSFNTSQIITEATTVTRTKDVLKNDVSGQIVQGQGSIYCEFDVLGIDDGAFPTFLDLSDGTLDNRITISSRGGSNYIRARVINSGSTTVDIVSSNNLITPNTKHKVMVTYKDNDVKLYFDGIKIGEDTSTIIPTNLKTLNIGCRIDNSAQLNGHNKNYTYYKEILSEAEAITKTRL